MSEPAGLSVGILIIGSLLWDERRQAWRNARLDMASIDTVTAPIRYGRLSSSRGNTYTMVFSRLCKPGQAKLVHCSHTVSSPEDLIAEAEYLWKAEQPGADAGRIAVNWGCVGLLSNPERGGGPRTCSKVGRLALVENPIMGMFHKRTKKVRFSAMKVYSG